MRSLKALSVSLLLLTCAFSCPAQSGFQGHSCRTFNLYPIQAWLQLNSLVKAKSGFIDTSGKVVIDYSFDSVSPFSQDLALVYADDQPQFIDELGQVVLRPEANLAEDFSDGLAAVRVGKLWGFIDKKGSMAISPQFTHVTPFHEGIARADREFIDKKGHVLFWRTDDGSFEYFSEGLAVHSGKNAFGYVDKQGRWAIAPKFGWAEAFHGGLAAVRVGKFHGYIFRNGKFAIPPTFAEIGPFSEGLAAVKIATEYGGWDKVGFINQRGDFKILPQFDIASPFCGGMAAVQIAGLWGYIDRKGDIAIPPQFQEAWSFFGALAPVFLKDGTGTHFAYVNRQGQIVWKSEGLYGPEY